MTELTDREARTGVVAGDSRLGFTTMEEEVQVDLAPVDGDLPDWLTGRLIRVTPALLDYSTAKTTKSLGHWFDGLAMINCFTINGQEVSYASRFLQTKAYQSIRAGKGIRQPITFGADPCKTLGRRIMAIFDGQVTDNTNINLARIGERYVALTEMPIPVEFDPKTLATLGNVEFDEDVPGQFGPLGHPHGDRDGAMIGFFAHPGRKASYRVHRWEPDTTVRREIARVPYRGAPRYMHSFAMSDRYIVLTAQPLSLKFGKVLRTGKIMDGMVWDPAGTTDFIVIDRSTGEQVGTYQGEPFFFFHHVNAYDDGDDIVIDVVAMNDPTSVWSLELEKLRDPDHKPRFFGELRRYRLNLTTGRITVKALSRARVEFPRINYHVNGRHHQFVYCAAYAEADSAWFDQLVKIDVDNGLDLTWGEDGCFPGEPVFVRRPDSSVEDDGVVISVVLDTRTGKSFLLVLDASTLTELARVHAPHHIGFNFHGGFFRDPA